MSGKEFTGVIPLRDILGDGWFICDVQAHYVTEAELVDGGVLNDVN